MQLRRLTSLVILFTLASAVSSSSSNSSKLNGWFSCNGATFSDQGSLGDQNAECAVYSAPLCYPGICEASKAMEKTVDIFVKRILATVGDAAAASNVWLLQGGPGLASSSMEAYMVDLHERLNGTVNVYTMDHRGTGRSTLFDCVAAQATTTGSPLGNTIGITEVPACAQDLETKYGDLASFSITSAATDLATLISEYSNGASTIVYGVSYGTAMVERLIHLNPPEVVGYVLDSVATSSGASADKFVSFSAYDTDFGEVGDAFLELCTEDAECSKRFKPSGLRPTLMHLMSTLDKEPKSTCAALVDDAGGQTGEPPSYTLRRKLGSLLASPATRKFIPPVVYRLQRCSPDDTEVLTYFFKAMNETSSAKPQGDAFISDLLYNLIVYSEMWESPQPSNASMLERWTNSSMSDGGMYGDIELYCAFSKEKSAVCDQLHVSSYNSNGIIYERDQYWNKSAIIPRQASVLLLNGKLDPLTPPKYAEDLLEALDGENKELITFEYATHHIIASTPLGDNSTDGTCGMQLLMSYITDSGNLTSLDRSCVDQMPAFNLTISSDNLYSYFNTDEGYDGVILSENGSRSEGA